MSTAIRSWDNRHSLEAPSSAGPPVVDSPRIQNPEPQNTANTAGSLRPTPPIRPKTASHGDAAPRLPRASASLDTGLLCAREPASARGGTCRFLPRSAMSLDSAINIGSSNRITGSRHPIVSVGQGVQPGSDRGSGDRASTVAYGAMPPTPPPRSFKAGNQHPRSPRTGAELVLAVKKGPQSTSRAGQGFDGVGNSSVVASSSNKATVATARGVRSSHIMVRDGRKTLSERRVHGSAS